ncbi:uncharacterized protein Z520_01281 [Fonsecaea multimorphosa CBS 102226]|uniref:Uncharacterized protein n=1 Tax=Fonsecaea multimorphosa CBS 102226 TaxID=1442371 RepID=A0A0D2HLP6_9EURO|nr:uncharacterized protein Z520_01281 [Fonsecaea multimorphosa CBS 102226]KIY02816.1 hypothetical protein Z520_01281 [Fonsecaea multimorphosa CBS 102226]OAL30981.1 hypothetical protein AYO22_01276 [Fonsecaea multimorphosa]
MSSPSASEETLSPTTTRSSTKSNMKISMPPPPSAFVHPSPAYIIAPTPSPTQNPNDGSWHPQDHSHHHIHIATPHPLAAAANFLDKHVPLFAKHHAEFATQHEIRAAKREARHSLVESPIPEMDAESVMSANGGAVGAAIHSATVMGTAAALGEPSQHALDPAAWNEVLAKREAARLRSGSNMTRTGADFSHDIASDSESKTSGSPAITP